MSEQKKLRVELDKSHVGYTVAENIYKEKEIKLLSEGMVLTERFYELLKVHEIKNIYVYEKTEEPEPEEV
ncbi:hypothetical protein CVD28_03515 [Bacillus sp. M6-12]|uniref:hypothetical protein n=1 Tax=Bacillus sp. M6-12 TaxID=2054166 RepID=UPI000C75DDA1|nr:hypothetical protein [Bacillus sp. M6-12]PLS19497.1 hypothetical protein CVD28_03515 [Bacillus sp. M6-12]